MLSINKLGHEIGKAGVPPFEVKLGGNRGKTNVGAFYTNEQKLNYVRANQARTFSSDWMVMNRYWTIKPQTELSGNEQVIVRHYYKIYDLDDMKLNFNNLVYYKINSLTNQYNIDPQTDLHNSLQGAASFIKDGIWLYEKGREFVANSPPSISSHKQGSTLNLVNDLSLFPRIYKGYPFGGVAQRFPEIDNFVYYSGDFVVGRLNGGGGIGGQKFGGDPRGFRTVLQAGSDWYYYFNKDQAPLDIAGFNWKGGKDGLNSDQLYESYDTHARWSRGPAPLGYSPADLEGGRRDGEITLLPACQDQVPCYEARGQYSTIRNGCPTCDQKWITTYYRSSFNVDNLSYYKSILINSSC